MALVDSGEAERIKFNFPQLWRQIREECKALERDKRTRHLQRFALMGPVVLQLLGKQVEEFARRILKSTKLA